MATATEKYAGWKIRCGFLDGNLGDAEAVAHASDYADLLTETLELAYPGAKVDVQFQKRCSGSVPFCLRTMALDVDGNEVDAENDRINQIADDVFVAGVWLE